MNDGLTRLKTSDSRVVAADHEALAFGLPE